MTDTTPLRRTTVLSPHRTQGHTPRPRLRCPGSAFGFVDYRAARDCVSVCMRHQHAGHTRRRRGRRHEHRATRRRERERERETYGRSRRVSDMREHESTWRAFMTGCGQRARPSARVHACTPWARPAVASAKRRARRWRHTARRRERQGDDGPHGARLLRSAVAVEDAPPPRTEWAPSRPTQRTHRVRAAGRNGHAFERSRGSAAPR